MNQNTEITILEKGEYENKKYSEKLEKSRYKIGKDQLWYEGKRSMSPISNFLIIIDEQINLFNGRDETTMYKVHAVIIEDYRHLPSIVISSQDLENFNFVINAQWNLEAIVSAGTNNKDKLREATLLINKGEIERKNIYTNAGFIKIGDDLIYLSHNNYIGNINSLSSIDVDLSENKLEKYSFVEKDFDIRQAICNSFSILFLADICITIPLLATIYLAPLTSILREEDIKADYILWIEGPSGTRKSSLTALALSHFGDFTRDDFPCSFRDTLNAIEKKAFILKDTVNVVDDYNPEVLGNRKLEVVEKLFGMYGDRTGRDRMSQDGKTLKGAYTARGLCIVTGESFPEVAQSRIARSIIVDVNRNSIDLSKMSKLQEKEEKEKLSYCMKKYIEWIINNEANIRNYAKNKMAELQLQTQSNKLHGRTNEAINVMTIGFSMFLGFMQSYGFIQDDRRLKFEELCKSTLEKIAINQMKEVEENNPVKMFFNAVEELYITQKIHMKSLETYNYVTNKDSTYVGFIGKTNDILLYYFFPDEIYKEVVKFYKEQDIKFPISKSALWKYLDIEGCLYKTANSQRRTVRRKVPSKDKNVNNFVTVLPILAGAMPFIRIEPKDT